MLRFTREVKVNSKVLRSLCCGVGVGFSVVNASLLFFWGILASEFSLHLYLQSDLKVRYSPCHQGDED